MPRQQVRRQGTLHPFPRRFHVFSPSGTCYNIIVKAFQSQNLVKTAVRGTGCQWHLQWQAATRSTAAGGRSIEAKRGLGRVGLAACGSLGGSGGSDAWQEGVRNEASAQHTKPLFMRVLYTPRHMSLFTRKTLWFYPLTGQLCAQQLLAPDIVIHLRGEG